MNVLIFESELSGENRTSIVLVNDRRQMLCEIKRTGDKTGYEPYEFVAKPDVAEQTAAHLRQGTTLAELAGKLDVSRLDWDSQVIGPISPSCERQGSF